MDLPVFCEISVSGVPDSMRDDMISFIPSFLPFCSLLFPYSSSKLILSSIFSV